MPLTFLVIKSSVVIKKEKLTVDKPNLCDEKYDNYNKKWIFLSSHNIWNIKPHTFYHICKKKIRQDTYTYIFIQVYHRLDTVKSISRYLHGTRIHIEYTAIFRQTLHMIHIQAVISV